MKCSSDNATCAWLTTPTTNPLDAMVIAEYYDGIMSGFVRCRLCGASYAVHCVIGSSGLVRRLFVVSPAKGELFRLPEVQGGKRVGSVQVAVDVDVMKGGVYIADAARVTGVVVADAWWRRVYHCLPELVGEFAEWNWGRLAIDDAPPVEWVRDWDA